MALALTAGCTDATAPSAGPTEVTPATSANRVPCSPASPSGTTAGTVDRAAPVGLVPPPGPARFVGTVTEGLCHRPVDGVLVYLYGGTNTFVIGTTRTDGAGRYAFLSVPSGSYRVGFVDPTAVYIPSFFPGGADLDSATPLTATIEETTVDATLFTADLVPAPAYTETSPRPERRIAVVGDSLVQLSTTAIRRKLDPLGASSVRGLSNQRIDQLLPIATKLAATDPTDVVLAVGNNDIRQHRDIGESINALRSMIELFGDARCVVVLNLNAHTLDEEFNVIAAQFNEQLAESMAAQARVVVVDWDEVVALLLERGESHSTWFTDGLHLTEAGEGAYASTMQGAIERCGS